MDREIYPRPPAAAIPSIPWKCTDNSTKVPIRGNGKSLQSRWCAMMQWSMCVPRVCVFWVSYSPTRATRTMLLPAHRRVKSNPLTVIYYENLQKYPLIIDAWPCLITGVSYHAYLPYRRIRVIQIIETVFPNLWFFLLFSLSFFRTFRKREALKSVSFPLEYLCIQERSSSRNSSFAWAVGLIYSLSRFRHGG